jgi:signal transduction histidine kinase
MNKTALIGLSLLVLTMRGAPVSAAEFASAQEAKGMLDRAVAEVRTNPSAAIAKFNNAAGDFRDRDLYVFCFNGIDGKTVSHVAPSIIGRDARSFKDKNGKPFGEMFFHEAKEGTLTVVSYVWPRPGSDEAVAKESYVTRIGDLVCGVGYYK